MEVTGASTADEFFKQLNLSKSSSTSTAVQESGQDRHMKHSDKTSLKVNSKCKRRHQGFVKEPKAKFSKMQIPPKNSGQIVYLDKHNTESDIEISDFDDENTSNNEVFDGVNSVIQTCSSARKKMLQDEVKKGTDYKVLKSERVLKGKFKSPPYNCVVKNCAASFKKWKKFVRHWRQHQSCFPYSCTQCESKFRCQIDLVNHLKRHFGIKFISCDICGERFDKRRSLVSHKIAKHSQKDDRLRNFRCTECGEAFLSKSAVDRHMRYHTGHRPEVCEYCDATFHTEYDLKEHVRIHTGEKPFQCDECDYCARTSQLLKRHKKSHKNDKPYQCEKCDFRCNSSQSLKRHAIKHSGNMPYKCPYCDYRCRDLDNVKKHIRTVKKHKGLKIYPCFSCTFSCNDSFSYLQHIKQVWRRTLQVGVSQINIRCFQCHAPNLDLKTAKATKLSGLLVETPKNGLQLPPIAALQWTKPLVRENHVELFTNSFTIDSNQATSESLYSHSRGDILLSSTAFDSNDPAQKDGALQPGIFNENTCWVPAVCGGATLHNPGDIQTQECIAILIEPQAGQKIEIHHNDSSVNVQLNMSSDIVSHET